MSTDTENLVASLTKYVELAQRNLAHTVSMDTSGVDKRMERLHLLRTLLVKATEGTDSPITDKEFWNELRYEFSVKSFSRSARLSEPLLDKVIVYVQTWCAEVGVVVPNWDSEKA